MTGFGVAGARPAPHRSSACVKQRFGYVHHAGRTYSASPLACASGRAEDATPVTEQTVHDHVEGAQVRQFEALDGQVRRLRAKQWRSRSTLRYSRAHA